MSRFTSLYLRVPRPKTLFGLISLQSATELISLALVFNKVTGFYGLLAILTGYDLSLLQLSTYIYSIAVLVGLIVLFPHIRKQSPFECLALAWLYIVDTVLNAFDTLIFGMEWYFTSATNVGTERLPTMVSQGLESLKQESAVYGKIVPQETALSMVLIVSLTLVRVYFSVIVMAYAQQVLHKYMVAVYVDSPEADIADGPFGLDLPNGGGRRGRMGRLMVSVGRTYWLEQEEEEFPRGRYGKTRTAEV